MANLGFQTVYRLLNEMDGVVCERAFLPQKSPDSKPPVPVKTLETGRFLGEFDVVAFSISFENDYSNLLTILENAKIPLAAAERKGRPLIMAGGAACFLNPEPLSDFVDVFVIGESEPVLGRIFELFDPREDRFTNCLNLAKNVPGVYVPSFYSVGYSPAGSMESFAPTEDVPRVIQRIFVPDLTTLSTNSAILTPDAEFGRTFLIEIGRGCPHGCRFCSAGYIYRPPRFRSFSQLTASMEEGGAKTPRIGLVGAAITDLPHLEDLCGTIQEANLQVSFSSLRADRITDPVVSLLSSSHVKTATLAPDAGSERMRRVIKKGIDERDLLLAVEKLVAAGIPNLKLYFMIGLPGETLEDVYAIVDLCGKIKQEFLATSKIAKRIGVMTVSVNPFVPKPFTPFQWAGMDDVKTLRQKLKIIQDGLRTMPNVRMIAENPRHALFQGILSRGDRKTGQLLMRLHRNRGNWPETLRESKDHPEHYALRKRSLDEILPWSFIDHGFGEGLLEREYQRALEEP
jgi:radical SAM superfamily enzyme YgiQ (UPF0313 family)